MSEGIEELCIDLQLKPDEFKVLGEDSGTYKTLKVNMTQHCVSVLAWQLDAEQMCRFSRSEFLRGCHAMKADSCRSIQTRLPELALATTADPDHFKELYRFTYKVSRELLNWRIFGVCYSLSSMYSAHL